MIGFLFERIREKLLDELDRQIGENYLEMKNGNYIYAR